MRFAQVHKVAVYILAALSLVVLGAGGELPPVSVGLVGVGVLLSWFAEGEVVHSERYARGWNVALLLVIGLQVARVTLFGVDWLITFVELASFLQVQLLSNRRSSKNYQLITSLALLQLIAATVLGGGLSYALCFVGFVIVTPWAMTLGHLRREIEGNYLADARAGRAGVPIDVARILRSRRVVGAGLLVGSSLLAVPIFMLTAVIFLIFPRIGLGVLSIRPHNENTVAGFGNEVDLSGHGTVRNNTTVVLRIQPQELPANPPPFRSFRLRGATFDHYTGRGWSRRQHGRGAESARVERDETRYSLIRLPDPGRDEALRIVLDPLEPPVLFLPEGTVGLDIEARFENGYPRFTHLNMDRDDGIRYSGAEGVGLVYTAYLSRAQPQALPRRPAIERSRSFPRRYLQLPASLSPRVRALAAQITRGLTTPSQKAQAVERYLAAFRYTLRLESGGAAQPLEDFLFRSHAGHCEYFSTAMAVLLRAADVPTRNVTGFLGGTYNRYGRFYAVLQGDAHSWVEVWDPQRGWLTFDPTPSSGILTGARGGMFSEADAFLEALRMRWRHYIVGFDLSTQAQIARRVWRFIDARRGAGGFSMPRLRGGGGRGGGRSLSLRSLRPVVAGVVGVGLLLLLASQLRAWRRAPGMALHRARTPSQRAAQDLAHALDELLAARGVPRPPSRSLLAFARELDAGGDPLGPVAVRVATRYLAARFGDEPLEPHEFDALRRALAQARAAPPSPPPSPDGAPRP
ncbi:MAG: transglutaminaseTgpA domain-containing protein [Polyangiales bacterium]